MIYPDNFDEHVHAIYFAARRGCSYHSLRTEFLDFVHRFIMFIVILMSSSSLLYVAALFFGLFGSILEHMDFLAIFSLITLFVGTSDIVFSWTARSRIHDTLSNRWGSLVERIDEKRSEGEGIDEEAYRSFVKEHSLIIRDEPLIYMALDAVAHNFVSRDFGSNQILVIPWYVKPFKNWIKFSNKRFTIRELPEQKVEKAK